MKGLKIKSLAISSPNQNKLPDFWEGMVLCISQFYHLLLKTRERGKLFKILLACSCNNPAVSGFIVCYFPSKFITLSYFPANFIFHLSAVPFLFFISLCSSLQMRHVGISTRKNSLLHSMTEFLSYIDRNSKGCVRNNSKG